MVTESEPCNGCIIKWNQRPQRLQFNINAHPTVFIYNYIRLAKLQAFPSGLDRD